MEKNCRIEYLDIMKGIAIVLVVIGHCCELPAAGNIIVGITVTIAAIILTLTVNMLCPQILGKSGK